MITVGRIVRPHGNRGRVWIAAETDFADDRFRAGETLHVLRAGVVERLTIAASRTQGGRWVVGFDAIDSIDAAEGLRGLEVRIPVEALRELGPGAFYVHDLIGCAVRTSDGRSVGTVERVDLDTGVPVLVVGGAEEVLVPLVDAICRRVDPGARLIEIEPPEGLLELNSRKRSRR
jgi:16S rRNA processing protein RimM